MLINKGLVLYNFEFVCMAIKLEDERMRKMIADVLVFIAILFLAISITFLGGYVVKMGKWNDKKTLDERIEEINHNVELAGLLITLTLKEREALDNLDKYYVIYGSAMQKSFCGRIRQMFFVRENFFKDCETIFKKNQRELLEVKSRSFLVRIFSAIPADCSDDKIPFNFFFRLN